MAKKATTPEAVEIETPADDASILKRILWVRQNVTRLGKDARVSAGGEGYAAITHDKVTKSLRPLMNDAGIVSWLTCVEAQDVETGANTRAGRKIVQHRACFDITFANVNDKDDCIIVKQWAYADDYGDKAPGKAASYAMKYALLKTFMVETGEDDEERVQDGGRKPLLRDDEDMMLNLYAVAEECFGDDAPQMLQAMSERRFMVENYGAIPQDRFDDAVRSLRKKAQQMENSDA